VKTVFDDILAELSRKIPSGIIDLNNQEHLSLLFSLVSESMPPEDATYLIEAMLGETSNLLVEEQPKSFPAVSSETGKTVYFKSKENRDDAIKAGTHTAVPRKLKPRKKKKSSKKKSSSAPSSGKGDKKDKKDSSSSEKDSSGGGGGLASMISGGAKKEEEKEEKAEKEKAKKAKEARLPPKVKPKLIAAYPVTTEDNVAMEITVGNMNIDHFKSEPHISDAEFDKLIDNTKKYKRFKSDLSFTEKISKKFPKKYLKFLERVFRVNKYNDFEPPVSLFFNGAGMGSISSQSAEVLMMAFAMEMDASKRKELHDTIVEYIDTVVKKSKVKFIIDKSWVSAAYNQAESLHARLRYTHKSGYDIVQVAWDNEADAIALGIVDYKKIRKTPTDVFFRIKADGREYILEDSLKKDNDVFLLTSSVYEVATFAVKKLSQKVQQEYKDLYYKLEHTEMDSAQRAEAVYRVKEIEYDALEKIPGINPRTYSDQLTLSAMNIANDLETFVPRNAGKRVAPKIDEKFVTMTVGENASDKELLTTALKTLAVAPAKSEEFKKALLSSSSRRASSRTYLKAIMLMSEYFASSGNGNLRRKLDSHYALIGDFAKNYLAEIVRDKQLRDGLMEKIDEAFPLRSLFNETSHADIGSIPVFKDVLEHLFKVKSYEDLKANLVVRTNERGFYELMYVASNKSEALPISKIYVRAKGQGYDTAPALELKLHPVFAKRIAQTNAELGIETTGIRQQINPKQTTNN